MKKRRGPRIPNQKSDEGDKSGEKRQIRHIPLGAKNRVKNKNSEFCISAISKFDIHSVSILPYLNL